MKEFYNPIKITTKGIRVLVTGSTGYIGGRLIPRLLSNNLKVRVLVRDKEKIKHKSWFSQVEIFEGDLTKIDSLDGLADGVDQAYYLIHSMSDSEDYIRLDRLVAENFVLLFKDIKQVIYLGGIAPEGDVVSDHLNSRLEVGRILRDNLPTTEFCAGPIIGSGSASFEMLRHLCEKLPVMVAPKWINHLVRPISIRDVLKYLILAIDKTPLCRMDIGSEPLTFKQMMLSYCDYRNLKRYIIPVPILAPGLAARWIGLVTPITNLLAVPIVKGIVNNIVGDTSCSKKLFPEIKILSFYDSIKSSFEKTKREFVETSWNKLDTHLGRKMFERRGRFEEVRILQTDSTDEALFQVIKSLGGKEGWLAWDFLWKLRKLSDRLIGGSKINDTDRDNLKKGDQFDCWKIEKYEENRKILLRMTLRSPGEAWLKLETIPHNKKTFLVITAVFEPKGIWGYLYWYSISPFHKFIFSDLARAVIIKAKNL
ncbi:MAG: SDR family oxidoreductase [Thermodesulfobacteriota bacterium]|nr:MAG: SDR family oxidoreductase [Candidatus Dadabacteria bacterium]